MLEILAFATQFLIHGCMKEAGISKTARVMFILWAAFWMGIGHIAGKDFRYAELDTFSGRLAEIFRALSVTWIIITILALGAFVLVWALSGFRAFTRTRVYLAGAVTLCMTVYCCCEAYFVMPRHEEIPTRKRPAGMDRLRIVCVSDAHIGGLSTYWHFSRMMRLVDEAKPDIFALLGDTIDGVMSYRERELAMLADTAKKAKYGAFAINGNHEYYWLLDEDCEQIIRDCGIRMLIDERAECAGITIISLDDDINGWLKPYLLPEDSEKFVLVLKHRPGLPFDAEGRFDLQLSGHTHNGQYWPLGYLKSMEADSTQGLSQKSGGYVYVSNGAGFNGPPMRFLTFPEITVIDLVREE